MSFISLFGILCLSFPPFFQYTSTHHLLINMRKLFSLTWIKIFISFSTIWFESKEFPFFAKVDDIELHTTSFIILGTCRIEREEEIKHFIWAVFDLFLWQIPVYHVRKWYTITRKTILYCHSYYIWMSSSYPKFPHKFPYEYP